MKTKYIYSILIGLVSIFIQAQQTPIRVQAQNGQTYHEAIGEVFSQNNTNRIPYGVLYDRVIGWSELVRWNSGNTTDFPHLKQAWYDLEKSNNNPGNTYQNLNYLIDVEKSKSKLPLLSIGYQFAYIDSLAVQDGRMRIENNKLIDNGGASPYLSKKVVLAGLATQKVLPNVNYTLIANSTFKLSNFTNETITGFTVKNTHTSQSYTLSANGSALIRFTGAGVQHIKITTHTNQGNYINYQKIEVQGRYAHRSASDIEADEHYLLTSSIPFKGYDESIATTSYADYHIFYHYPPGSSYSQKVLKKPIIILDGFDPMDQRNYQKLYNENLSYGNQNLGEQLRKKGYDVVILNFPVTGKPILNNDNEIKISNIPLVDGIGRRYLRRDGGTDYIERNAFLLVKLIQTLNTKLKSNGYGNEKLVVVGPSMGGQISRYALAYMEKHGLNHNTRLWASFDSPHLGANIPLALQKDLYFFGHTGEQNMAKEGYNKKLNTIAARQMLIEQLSDGGIALPNKGLNGTDPFHMQYYSNLKNNGLPGSNGWPQNLRKINLVNGAGNGLKTNQEGQRFLTLDAFSFRIKVAKIRNNFLPPTGQSIKYFEGKVTVTKFIAITFITGKGWMINTNPNGSMDVVQGGITDTQYELGREFYTALDKMSLVSPVNWSRTPNHCFIPTVSALGFKNPNFNWNNRVDNRDLVQTGEIPFDNYYLPSHNQKHVSLTEKSALWFLNQLDGNYYNWIEKMNLEGSDNICDQEETYTMQNIPPNTQFTWQVSSNLQIVSSNSSSITVKKVGNGSGYIKAVHNDVVIEKKVWIGGPNVSFNVLGMCGPYGQLDATVTGGKPPYKWYKNGNLIQTSYNEETTLPFGFDGGLLKVSSSNECGGGTYSRLVDACNNYYSMYPNPASGSVTLKLEESFQKSAQKSTFRSVHQLEYQVDIYNMSGFKVRSVRAKESEIQIPLQGLLPGIYAVHLLKDGKVYKKKLVVE